MSSPLSLGGVNLEQHAGVTAALAEGFPLDEILAAEQLDPARWRGADVAWKQRLAQDAASGAGIFPAHRLKVEEAEDCLSRAVSPLDDDLDAWLSFLHDWSKSADPLAMLKKLRLGANDISRLRRRWAKRMDGDPKLALKAAKRAADGAQPLPPISVAPAKLKPFPWSKRRPVAAAAPALPPRAGDYALADEFPLERYARLSAELAALPKGRAQILERYGLNERSHADIDAVWQARLAGDASLSADFRRLVAHHRARLDAAHHATPGGACAEGVSWPAQAPVAVIPPAQPLTENLEETAFILAAISDDVLPFQDDPDKPPPSLARLAPSLDVGATSDAIPALRDDPLAFFDMPSARNIDETAAVAALNLDDPLPFAVGKGAPPPLSATDPDAGDLSGETGFIDLAALGDLEAPLPFQAPASAATPPTGARLFGGLTVQQLAAVAVELSIAPGARPTILAQYGLSEQTARRAFDELRAEGDPALRSAWDDAYRQYHAYRVRGR